jgi:hypothetical protein
MTDIEFIAHKAANFSPFILYVAICGGLIFFKKLSPLYKSIFVYVLILLVCDWLIHICKYYWKNTLIVLFIYSMAELGFMIYFYKKYMFRNRQLLITILGISGLIYIITEVMLIFVFKELDIKQFQPYTKVVDNFIIILMALAYLHERMNRYREREWGSFRLNIVFLVFFTLNSLFFLPFNFMVNASNIIFYFWVGHIILLILFYLYLTFEIINNGLSNKIKKA